MVQKKCNKKEDTNGQCEEKIVLYRDAYTICDMIDEALGEIIVRQYFKARKRKKVKRCAITRGEIDLATWIVQQQLADTR